METFSGLALEFLMLVLVLSSFFWDQLIESSKSQNLDNPTSYKQHKKAIINQD